MPTLWAVIWKRDRESTTKWGLHSWLDSQQPSGGADRRREPGQPMPLTLIRGLAPDKKANRKQRTAPPLKERGRRS